MEQLWGRCPRCDVWFVIEDPALDSYYLCPTDLVRAASTETRLSDDVESPIG